MATYNFHGKRALVTGAARGIGRDIATRLCSAGATTYALDVLKQDLDSLVAEFPPIHPVHVDLLDWESTKKAVEAVGQIDLLVNNAGQNEFLSFFDITPEAFDRLIGVNLRSLICVSQVVAKGMADRRSGSIVNISSVSSSRAIHGVLVYGASKAAVDQVTRAMALELGPHQVRVNAVNPHLVMGTAISKPVSDDAVLSETFMKLVPLGRFLEKKDVTNLVLYLLSDNSDMIHGATIPVDGGYFAQGAISTHTS